MLHSSICNPTRARRHVGEYDMKRDSVEINHRAPQWSHNAVWNRKYMEPKPGYILRQLWADSEPAIGHKSSPSYEVKECDIRRAIAAIADLPSSTLPDSPSSSRWGRQQLKMSHHKLAPWHREPWRNRSAPCVKTRQLRSWADASRPTGPHPKDGGEMLIAIVLDRPLADAKACFFRPTPSWLSPGRYTRSTAAKRELWIMQGRLHVDSRKSAVIGR